MVIRSPLPDVEIPPVSVYEYLFGTITDAELERVAVVDGVSGAATTFRALRDQIVAVAGAVAARGFGVGDVVALRRSPSSSPTPARGSWSPSRRCCPRGRPGPGTRASATTRSWCLTALPAAHRWPTSWPTRTPPPT
jgi:hypothetical protein